MRRHEESVPASCLGRIPVGPGARISVSGNAVKDPIEVASLGPQVGEEVPAFNLPDQHGRVWTRDSILGPNGAILLFYRSADW